MKRFAALTLAMALCAGHAVAAPEQLQTPQEFALLNTADLAGACYAHLSVAALQVIQASADEKDAELRAQSLPLFAGARFWAQALDEEPVDAAVHWAPGVMAQELDERVPQLVFCASVAREGLPLLPKKKQQAIVRQGADDAKRAVSLRPH